MHPFLLLATRAEDRAADEEYEAFLRFSGLSERELLRVRLEAAPLPDLDLAALSGVVVGGSPFTSSDPEHTKSPTQCRVEAELAGLLDRVTAAGTPFLGACYGVGTLGRHAGGVVDATFAEPIGAVQVRLTEAGRADPLLAGMPPEFQAFVGHKEALTTVPPGAVVLATSDACPVQMFRVGPNRYATQFHPELDVPGICTRIEVYRDAGYFAPDELAAVLARVRSTDVHVPPAILRRFVELFAR